MANSALFFFGYLGVFNGFVLSIYFFFFTAKKQLSAYLLGALLFVLSVRIGKSVAYFFDYNLSRTILQLGLTACFFIGPFLYFFVRAEIDQIKKLPQQWIGQTVFWAFVIMVTGILYPYQSYPRLWGYYFIPAIYLQWAAYAGVTIVSLIPVIKKMIRKQPTVSSAKWLLGITAAVTVIFLCYMWSLLNITKGSYISGALSFSIVVYLVAFVLLYRKKTNELFPASTQKYADKKIDASNAELILSRLEKTMTEKELFKNPNLKISELAKEINVPAHQLSQVLNDNLNKNFTLFVNEYRIREACKMLSQNANLTIEAIGDEVGFNSKSTFFATFKKIKGTTPSNYQQSVSAGF